MKIVVTGARGFIGKNLCTVLKERDNHDIKEVDRGTSKQDLEASLSDADLVFHLAGINRPRDVQEFSEGNVKFTKLIVDMLDKFDRCVPIVFSSSKQAELDNPYGRTKYMAEELIRNYSKRTGAKHYIFRFPNVFGKWCKPDYNSFVATFCARIMDGKEISIHDPNAPITLVYIDDVCESLVRILEGGVSPGLNRVPVEFKTTVGEVANIIKSFKASRMNATTESVGTGLTRALYATYLSYTSPENFSYKVTSHTDERGIFCEVLKTDDAGQFSFFTAHPGVKRGGHYHHTKTEKFLVIKGEAKFNFRHIITGEKYSLTTSEDCLEIVDTVPGWIHEIANTGNDDLVVMLWASEIFDSEKPDTKAAPI